MQIAKDVEVLSAPEFNSDHRISRCKLSISKRPSYKTRKARGHKATVIIPVYKIDKARKLLKSKLLQLYSNNKNLQARYDETHTVTQGRKSHKY